MTAVLVGFLVAVAGLAWSAAGAGGRRAPLRAWVGRGDLAGGAARAAPLTRRPGWLAARRRLGRAERAEADALELLDGLAPALRAGLPPVTALLLVTSSRSLDSAAPSKSPARPASPRDTQSRRVAPDPYQSLPERERGLPDELRQ